MDCPAGFSFGDIPDLPAQLLQPGGSRLFIGHGDEGTYVGDIAFCHCVDVVFQILGIRNHNGTVVVVLGAWGLLMFIKNAGMEDGADPLVDQPLHMAMGQLGGVALGL